MNYEQICSLVKAGVNGLEIKNCDKIQEIPNLPELYVLAVEYCPNLRKIHVKRVQEKIILMGLPELTEFSMEEEDGHEIVVNECPRFIVKPQSPHFDIITYQEGCWLAHEKYCPETDYLTIEDLGGDVYRLKASLPDGKTEFGREFRTVDVLRFVNGEFVKN